MDRHIVMFLALLLFGSSVLASGAKAGEKEDPNQPKWSFWNETHKADQFDEFDDSDAIESAYSSDLKGYTSPNGGYIDFDTMIQVKKNPDGSTASRRAVRRKGPVDSSIGPSTDICQWSSFDFTADPRGWKPYPESQLIKSSKIEREYLTGRGSAQIGAVTFDFDLWTSKIKGSHRRRKPLLRKCSPALEGKIDEAGAELKLSGYGPTWLYWSTESKKFEQYPQTGSILIEKAYQLKLAGKRPKKPKYGRQFDLQVEFPPGFKMSEPSDKLVIDFEEMRQFVRRVVPSWTTGSGKIIPERSRDIYFRAIRRLLLQLGAKEDKFIRGYIREFNAAHSHSLYVPQVITDIVAKHFYTEICPGRVEWQGFRKAVDITWDPIWIKYDDTDEIKYQDEIEAAYQRFLLSDEHSEATVGNFTFDFNYWISTSAFRIRPVPIRRECLASVVAPHVNHYATATNGLASVVAPDVNHYATSTNVNNPIAQSGAQLVNQQPLYSIVPTEPSASTRKNNSTRFIFVAFFLIIVFGVAVYYAKEKCAFP
eukprot:456019_1